MGGLVKRFKEGHLSITRVYSVIYDTEPGGVTHEVSAEAEKIKLNILEELTA